MGSTALLKKKHAQDQPNDFSLSSVTIIRHYDGLRLTMNIQKSRNSFITKNEDKKIRPSSRGLDALAIYEWTSNFVK